LPYGPIAIDPAAKVLHYAQAVFEGLKAYWVENEAPATFRIQDHAQRLNASASLLALPPLPDNFLLNATRTLVQAVKPCIPRNSGSALYLRPIIFGSDADLSVSASQNATFLLLASPSEIYHAKAMSVWIETIGVRAMPGGLGLAKASANYAQTLNAQHICQQRGFDQVLWCQPDSGNIDELSAMNLFAYIDNHLITPALTDTRLAGIIRDSILTLVRQTGMQAIEREFSVKELTDAIQAGRCKEIFASGTAAIVASVRLLADQTHTYTLPQEGYPVAADIYAQLLDIQEGRAQDTHQWMTSLIN
jgi:branched-chain amino acid aminotransferase